MDNSTDSEIRFDVFELIRLILKHRKMVITIVVLAGLAAVVYSLLTPQIWRSEAAFYAVSNKDMQLPLAVAAMGEIGKDLLDKNMQIEAINCITIMSSRAFSEKAIRQFNLIDYFRLDSPDSLANLDDALRMLPKIITTDYGDQNNLITVVVDTKSKSLSRNMAEFYVNNLDLYLRQNRMVKGKRNRIFLESRVNELRHDLDSLQVALSDFETKHYAVDLEKQTEVLIDSYSETIATRMQLDIALEMARENYAPGSPEIKNLEIQLAEINKQIHEKESSKKKGIPEYQLDLSHIPALQAAKTKLEIDLAITRKVLDSTQSQYEKAKLEEQKNLPLLEIIDSPREAGLRERPHRAIICLSTVLVAFFMAVLMAIIVDVIQSSPDRIQVVIDAIHKKF